MDLIEKSLEIALKAYSGQKDKAGETYILHPLRIMAKMESTEERCIALLHDVIEDSEITAEDLIAQGLPKNVVVAIEALTKNNGENYEDFVDRVMKNALATKVKIADIEDNINVLRLNSINDTDLQRVAKYHRAWKKLSGIS
jgi:(p)ppGpp synthase/HD superfamily hydrolase